MGKAQAPATARVAQARGECKTVLEHGQVGSWPVVRDPLPGGVGGAGP